MSARPDFRGDYMGFTYGSKHSSDLGIVRVSSGGRFNENLLPTIQDKTVQVPGGDGTYYFGSYYTQRQFSVPFAFDSLTEQQVAELKSHFGDKQIHDLIFDETPYKVYRAKVTGTATMKYLAFSEGETNRLYKGEGTLQFTCYDPYARSRYKSLGLYKQLPEYANMDIETREKAIGEWKEAARLRDGLVLTEDSIPKAGKKYYLIEEEGLVEYDGNQIGFNLDSYLLQGFNNSLDMEGNILKAHQVGLLSSESLLSQSGIARAFYEYANDNIDIVIDGEMQLWNPGDKDSVFILEFKPEANGSIILSNGEQLTWSNLPVTDIKTIKINTRLWVVEGYNAEGKKIGIYNKYFSGNFFKIPRNTFDPELGDYVGATMTVSGADEVSIKYDYYYL